MDAAFRGYKEINLQAMRLLAAGGLLVTCSCSQPVTTPMFAEMLAEAAADAQVRLQVVARHGAPPDHPVRLGHAASDYLKCFFLQRVDETATET